ncbi:MAG: hypothetical protein VXZ18_17140, partial [Pseudomonadota bacterium]|nr:hypothetical protein [Pseudomonadota bacterium]
KPMVIGDKYAQNWIRRPVHSVYHMILHFVHLPVTLPQKNNFATVRALRLQKSQKRTDNITLLNTIECSNRIKAKPFSLWSR